MSNDGWVSKDTYNGKSVGDVVTTQWRGYYRIIKIETTNETGWNSKVKYVRDRYHVQMFCNETGHVSKKTKIRETYYNVTKIEAVDVDKWKQKSADKWDRIKSILFPESIEEVEEVENTKEQTEFFKPLSGLLRDD